MKRDVTVDVCKERYVPVCKETYCVERLSESEIIQDEVEDKVTLRKHVFPYLLLR